MKMMRIGNRVNLVICQKSKVSDWCDHFDLYRDSYFNHNLWYDLTDKNGMECFLDVIADRGYTQRIIGVINYDLIFRRPKLLEAMKDIPYTLMLDESSLICNENAKRSRTILRMSPSAVILLSGTPTAGKYEKLWSQCRLLGWRIRKDVFWNSYICTKWVDFGAGFMQQVVTGYKNVEHLKGKLAEYGALFLKTSEVMDLPEQVEQVIRIRSTRDYARFTKDSYLMMKDGTELAGDNTLTKMLYQRQLCGQYHKGKLDAFRDLITSTEDHLVVFYNFTAELMALMAIAADEGRRGGVINGQRHDDVKECGCDILFVQYQAGAYGLNLQRFSNKIIYFTLPLGKGSCDMWEQSKKRIHRIGQKDTCFYYYLIVTDSIETRNMEALKEGKDLTNALFEEG